MRGTRNLGLPFRRDGKRDFLSVDGAALVYSKVRHLVLTRGATSTSTGEMPWRTSFGAGLQRLRHMNHDVAIGEMARVTIQEALQRFIPEVELLELRVQRDEEALMLHLKVRAMGTAEEPVAIAPLVMRWET